MTLLAHGDLHVLVAQPSVHLQPQRARRGALAALRAAVLGDDPQTRAGWMPRRAARAALALPATQGRRIPRPTLLHTQPRGVCPPLYQELAYRVCMNTV